ncbi:unnamed protein product [Dracunculus medinensis]|uniref:Fibronectin type-III domain-containing protein n=1 Tax=Dracunculus medinensis TaxID=318479 RepID=A0A0N4UH11_DRAME|nr:unnamed protein product [Dracunculus medinensis]
MLPESPGEQKKIYNITLPYRNKNEFKIENLEPKSKYLVWISALNEAGASRESQPQVIETTIPWAPEAPSDVRYNCLANCDLIWKAPNDFGSPITAYKLFIREMKNKEEMRWNNDFSELSDYRIKFGNIGTWRIFIYALICLMLLFVFIDIACCFIARCGLTAYIFFHCLANNINSTKQRDNDHSVKSNTAMKNDQTTQSTSV